MAAEMFASNEFESSVSNGGTSSSFVKMTGLIELSLGLNEIDPFVPKEQETPAEEEFGRTFESPSASVIYTKEEFESVNELTSEPNIKITQAMIDEEAAFRRKLRTEEKIAEQKRKLEVTRQAAFEKLQKLLQCSKSYSSFILQELDRLQKTSNCQEKPNQAAKNKENQRTRKRSAEDQGHMAAKRKKLVKHLEKPTFSHESVDDIELPEKEQSLDAFEEPSAATKRKSPVLLSGGEMRSYQLDGFDWLNVMYENGVSCILADEMGLGKTIQSIAFICNLIEEGVHGPFLVCAPLSTLPNWVLEFQRFAPKLPVLLFHGDKATRKDLSKNITLLHKFGKYSSYPVVVTSYQMPLMERGFFQSCHWRTMIIDEGHRIKNINSCLRSKLVQCQVDHKVLLTGTPLQNNLTELWSLLNFILPDIFSDLAIFESWFDVASLSEEGGENEIIHQEQEKHVLVLMHEILSPFLLRRTKQEVELLLPSKKEMLVYAPMTAKQETLYRMTADRTISQLLGNQKKEDDEVLERTPSGRIKRKCSSQNAKETKSMPTHKFSLTLQNIIMQFRKICNHPYLVEHPVDLETGNYELSEEFVDGCGKMQVMDCLLKGLKSRGHKILIFSQMVRMLNIIEDYCDLREWTYCRLDGTMSIGDRGVQIKKFNEDPEVFLFLISTRAGGLGLNLTSADTVIIYDSDWNPQCDLQAQDRCHRIGQTKPVVVYRLVTQNSIEERIVARASAKRKLEKMIIKKGRFTGVKKEAKCESLSIEELKELLSSTDHREQVRSRKGDIFTPEEINILLDRSDLLPENAQASSAEVKGLFKVINSNI